MNESASYAAVHQRIRRKFGAARDHMCVSEGCEAMASVWAWQRTGPSAAGVVQGKAMTWGLSLDDYTPMCSRHNATLDRGGTLTHCPSGHLREQGNIYKSPTSGLICKTCKSEQKRARRLLNVRRVCPTCNRDYAEAYLGTHIRTVHALKRGEGR